MILNSKRVWAVVGAGYFLTTLSYLSADGSERSPILPSTSSSSRFDRLHPHLSGKNPIDLHKRDNFAKMRAGDQRFERLYPHLAGQSGADLHKRDHFARIHLEAAEDRFNRLHPEVARQNGLTLHKRDHFAKIDFEAKEERFERLHPELARQNTAHLHKRDHFTKIRVAPGEDRFDRLHPNTSEFKGVELHKIDQYAKLKGGSQEDRFDRLHPNTSKFKGVELHKIDQYAKLKGGSQEDRFDRLHSDTSKFKGVELHKIDQYAKLKGGSQEDRFDRLHPNTSKFKGVELHKIDQYAKLKGGSQEDRFDRLHSDTSKFKGVELHKIDYYAKLKGGAQQDRFDRLHSDTSRFKGVELHKIDYYAKLKGGAQQDRFDRLYPDASQFKGLELHKIDYYAKLKGGAQQDRFDRLYPGFAPTMGLDLRKRDHFVVKMGENRFDRLHPELSNFIALDMRKWGDLAIAGENKTSIAKDKKKQILLLADTSEQFALKDGSAKEGLSRFNRLHPELNNLIALDVHKWGEREASEKISIAKDSRKQANLVADSKDRICNLFAHADSSKRTESCYPEEEKGELRSTEPYANARKNVGWQKVSMPDVFATGEFLWWQVREDGLDYAISSNALPPPSGTGMIDGDVKKMPFGYDPGFRLGLGSIFGGNLWDLSLNWTRFHTKESVFERAPVNGFLLPTKFVSFEDTSVFQGASHASARWRIKYDTISLELGRAFTPIRYLALRPHMGLTSGWINQRASFEYDQIASPGVTLEVRDKNKFAGVGLRGGVNLRCPLGKGWSIFGDFAASLLWGRFHVHQKENQILSSGIPLERLNLRDKEHDVVSAIQAVGGVRWDRYFWKERTHLGLSLGYEFNEWFRQNRLMAFTEPNSNPSTLGNIVRNPGDLQFQGLTAGARFDF